MGIPLCCNICTFVPMNEEQKISVVINTYNAEKHLRKVLDSLKDFDEVLICDMESTDSTLSIASDYACRTITFPKEGHSIVEPAREYAIHEAKYPWVLVVDADEVVSAELRTYLYQHIASSAPAEGIRIPRKNYFMGRFMHAAYPDYVLRFFRKDLTTWPAIIHASPIVQGRILVMRLRSDDTRAMVSALYSLVRLCALFVSTSSKAVSVMVCLDLFMQYTKHITSLFL